MGKRKAPQAARTKGSDQDVDSPVMTVNARWLTHGASAVLGCVALVFATASLVGALQDDPGAQGGAGKTADASSTDAKKSGTNDQAARWNSQSRGGGLIQELTKGSEQTFPGVEGVAEQVSSAPRAYVFESFLDAEECDYLINLSSGKLQPAGVVATKDTQYDLQTQSRNNYQHWITNDEEREYPMLRHIMRRMHRVARIPDTDAEGLQIGRYTEGQKYEMHIDSAPAHDVTRPATLLLYLSDVDEGGDTLWPLSNRKACEAVWHGDVYGCAECCKEDVPGTLKLKPKRGTAVLFFNHHPNGKLDSKSEHIACPVRAGTKWIAQRWFRTSPYQRVRQPVDRRFDGFPLEGTTAGPGPWDGRVRVLSQKSPRLYLLESFLTAEECDHILAMSEQTSKTEGGHMQFSSDALSKDQVLREVSRRMNLAAYQLPEDARPLKLLHYAAGSSRPVSTASEAGEFATLLVFLADGAGGEAIFPVWQKASLDAVCPGKGTDHRSDAIPVPPVKGRAVLVYRQMTPSCAPGSLESASYGICPVQESSLGVLEQSWGPPDKKASRTTREEM